MSKVNRGLNLLTKEGKKRCLEEIITYFDKERDEQIGLVAAEDMLDFFLHIVGNEIYNSAVDDVKNILKKQLESLDFEAELLKRQK